MQIILIAFLLLAASLANADTVRKTRQNAAAASGSCGQTFVEPRTVRLDQQNQRIIGGVEAKPHSFPYIVSIRRYGGSHFCGGTLVRVGNANESDIVISASHCINTPGKCNHVVAIGAHSQQSQATGEQRVNVIKCVKHEKYNWQNWHENDVAILKLEKPVQFSKTIQPACLPNQNEQVPDNSYGIVAGWGYTRESGTISPTLMQVSVPTIGAEKCKTNYYGVLAHAHLCAGYPEGAKDACQGDSGGPFVVRSNRGYVLQGVVSFGDGCARAGKPGVYARVSSYTEWINEKIRTLTSVGTNGGNGNSGGSNCVDRLTYCDTYIKECQTADWMKTNCPKTCGFQC